MPTPPRHSRLVRCIAMILLALIVIAVLAVLIIWLSIKPRKLVYTIEEGSIYGFNLNNNSLNATFNFVLKVYNPNNKVSIYYDRVEATVSYNDDTMAYSTIDPFFQPHRNVTTLPLKLVAQNASLFGSSARDLRLERSAGVVELEVLVKAKIRFKVGTWKSRHRILRLLCAPLLVHFSSSRDFERTSCDVDL